MHSAHGLLRVDNPQHWGTHRVDRRLDAGGRKWFDVHVVGRVVAAVKMVGDDHGYDAGDLQTEGRRHG
jgi:hypothetical protein